MVDGSQTIACPENSTKKISTNRLGKKNCISTWFYLEENKNLDDTFPLKPISFLHARLNGG